MASHLSQRKEKANGLFLKGNLTFNTTIANLGSYKNGPALSDSKMTKATSDEIKIMHTKCMGPEDMISALSGGNQQKVIFGKWLERGPQIFMMDEPTRGIDVGAKYEIYELIINMAKQGKTVIVVSSEMPEILGITNRIGVMSNGRLSGNCQYKGNKSGRVAETQCKVPIIKGEDGYANSKILTAEQERALRQLSTNMIGGIQKEIDALRKDGTTRVVECQSAIAGIKRDKTLSKGEKESEIAACEKELAKAKAVEAKNRDEISKLIAKAESYLKENFDSKYYNAVKASCEAEKAEALAAHNERMAELDKKHKAALAKTSDSTEIKEENYVHKNRISNEKLELEKEYQTIKDKKHEAYSYKYHLIDMLRLSKFTFMEKRAQKWENYKYTFNKRNFLLQNGLYIAIILIFIALCIITPIKKGTPLLTYNNILNILQQASPRMFLALGVAGLILLTGTDLSVGRMVGMGMTTATIIMHQGINTGSVFGHIFDFTGVPTGARVVIALIACIVLCTFFTSIAGFFTAKFKMHPFISTMANMLVIFGIVTYATKGVSFGAIEPVIPNMIIPKLNGFPTIILWAVAAIAIVWFIWNKTTFGKNLYAVGGNPEGSSSFRYLSICSNSRRIRYGRYPLWIWLMA